MRTFIAIELGGPVKKALEDMIDSLRKLGRHIKWAKPHNLHLTLKFIGEVSADQLPAIQNCMQLAAARQPKFTLKVRGTGAFPSGSRSPRVLWVGIESQPALVLLQQELEHELQKLGFPKEKRPFSPHLTIGRVRNGKDLRPVLSALERWADSDFGAIQADRMVLFKSILKPSGAEYSSLFEAGLP